jgi:hypothetical protein
LRVWTSEPRVWTPPGDDGRDSGGGPDPSARSEKGQPEPDQGQKKRSRGHQREDPTSQEKISLPFTARGHDGEKDERPDDPGGSDQSQSHILGGGVQRPDMAQQHSNAHNGGEPRAVPGQSGAFASQAAVGGLRGRAHRGLNESRSRPARQRAPRQRGCRPRVRAASGSVAGAGPAAWPFHWRASAGSFPRPRWRRGR